MNLVSGQLRTDGIIGCRNGSDKWGDREKEREKPSIHEPGAVAG